FNLKVNTDKIRFLNDKSFGENHYLPVTFLSATWPFLFTLAIPTSNQVRTSFRPASDQLQIHAWFVRPCCVAGPKLPCVSYEQMPASIHKKSRAFFDRLCF